MKVIVCAHDDSPIDKLNVPVIINSEGAPPDFSACDLSLDELDELARTTGAIIVEQPGSGTFLISYYNRGSVRHVWLLSPFLRQPANALLRYVIAACFQ